jgi:flagellar basal body-associated protein FliL
MNKLIEIVFNLLTKIQGLCDHLFIKFGHLLLKKLPFLQKLVHKWQSILDRIDHWKNDKKNHIKNKVHHLQEISIKKCLLIKEILIAQIQAKKESIHHYQEEIKKDPKTYLKNLGRKSLNHSFIFLKTYKTFLIISLFLPLSYVIYLKKHQKAVSYYSFESDRAKGKKDYYQKIAKSIILTNLVLPIYFIDSRTMVFISLDILIVTSNRHSSLFLTSKLTQLRDYILMTFRPFTLEFPLEHEGKQVVKEKITKELNNYLKKNHIEGSIKEIQFTKFLVM